jgi:hypothetical protein
MASAKSIPPQQDAVARFFDRELGGDLHLRAVQTRLNLLGVSLLRGSKF